MINKKIRLLLFNLLLASTVFSPLKTTAAEPSSAWWSPRVMFATCGVALGALGAYLFKRFSSPESTIIACTVANNVHVTIARYYPFGYERHDSIKPIAGQDMGDEHLYQLNTVRYYPFGIRVSQERILTRSQARQWSITNHLGL